MNLSYQTIYNIRPSFLGCDKECHKRCIKHQTPDQSALCEHSMTMDHNIDWENTIILKVETDYKKDYS